MAAVLLPVLVVVEEAAAVQVPLVQVLAAVVEQEVQE